MPSSSFLNIEKDNNSPKKDNQIKQSPALDYIVKLRNSQLKQKNIVDKMINEN